jgi:hypothetical protein
VAIKTRVTHLSSVPFFQLVSLHVIYAFPSSFLLLPLLHLHPPLFILLPSTTLSLSIRTTCLSSAHLLAPFLQMSEARLRPHCPSVRPSVRLTTTSPRASPPPINPEATNGRHEPRLKMAAFWPVAPCSLLGNDRRFRGSYYPSS